MTKTLAIGAGLGLMLVSTLVAAKPPQAARRHVTLISPVTVHGRAARPAAVQELSRVPWPFSHDRIGPTLTARIGKAVSRTPF